MTFRRYFRALIMRLLSVSASARSRGVRASRDARVARLSARAKTESIGSPSLSKAEEKRTFARPISACAFDESSFTANSNACFEPARNAGDSCGHSPHAARAYADMAASSALYAMLAAATREDESEEAADNSPVESELGFGPEPHPATVTRRMATDNSEFQDMPVIPYGSK